jgi:hypothetical protein
MEYSVYFVSLCFSVYYLCVNVCCTTATGCQPNCSKQIHHIINTHNIKECVSHTVSVSIGYSLLAYCEREILTTTLKLTKDFMCFINHDSILCESLGKASNHLDF